MKARKRYNLLLILISIFVVSCADQFSSSFDDSKDYNISKIDADACMKLSRTLAAIDTIVALGDTSYVANDFILARAGYHDTTLDAAWINAHDTLISSIYDTVYSDTINVVNNYLAKPKFYALYQTGINSKPEKLFYLSWDLASENVDSYFSIDIFDKFGSTVKLESDDIKIETVAGCTEVVTIGNEDQAIPKIRARLKYNLADGLYLIRFTNNSPKSVINFRVVVF